MGGKTTDYVSGAGMTIARLIDGVPTYVHSDHLGSPRELSTSAGGLAGWAHYSPFGVDYHSNLPGDQAGFTGPLPRPSAVIIDPPDQLFGDANLLRNIKDSDTGLNYMQARYYDPVIGRFLSVDPVGFVDTGHPGMFNRYSYTLNDPVNRIDPFGMASVCAQNEGSRLRSCVEVDGNGDGDTSDDDLSRKQKKAFTKAFGSYIRNNNGADISSYGTKIIFNSSGASDEQVSTARVGTQFIGASNGKKFPVNLNLTTGANAKSSGYAGSTTFIGVTYNPYGTLGKPPHPQEIGINIDKAFLFSNPSDLARTLQHELGHLSKSGYAKDGFGLAHKRVDARAITHIKRTGLADGGCRRIGGFLSGYPGC